MQILSQYQYPNMSFKRLYVPPKSVLSKYGDNFADNIDKNKAPLAKLLKDFDVYIIPRFYEERYTSFNEGILELMDYYSMYRLEAISHIKDILPKDNYVDLIVASKNAKRLTDIDSRLAWDYDILQYNGIPPEKLVSYMQNAMKLDNDCFEELRAISARY